MGKSIEGQEMGSGVEKLYCCRREWKKVCLVDEREWSVVFDAGRLLADIELGDAVFFCE